jgi:hypothetical protein
VATRSSADNPKDCILRLMAQATAQNLELVDQEN